MVLLTLMIESTRVLSANEIPFPGPRRASMCTVLYLALCANSQKVGLFSPSRQPFGKSDCRIPKRNMSLEIDEQLPPETATPKLIKWVVALRKGVVLRVGSFNVR